MQLIDLLRVRGEDPELIDPFLASRASLTVLTRSALMMEIVSTFMPETSRTFSNEMISVRLLESWEKSGCATFVLADLPPIIPEPRYGLIDHIICG